MARRTKEKKAKDIKESIDPELERAKKTIRIRQLLGQLTIVPPKTNSSNMKQAPQKNKKQPRKETKEPQHQNDEIRNNAKNTQQSKITRKVSLQSEENAREVAVALANRLTTTRRGGPYRNMMIQRPNKLNILSQDQTDYLSKSATKNPPTDEVGTKIEKQAAVERQEYPNELVIKALHLDELAIQSAARVYSSNHIIKNIYPEDLTLKIPPEKLSTHNVETKLKLHNVNGEEPSKNAEKQIHRRKEHSTDHATEALHREETMAKNEPKIASRRRRDKQVIKSAAQVPKALGIKNKIVDSAALDTERTSKSAVQSPRPEEKINKKMEQAPRFIKRTNRMPSLPHIENGMKPAEQIAVKAKKKFVHAQHGDEPKTADKTPQHQRNERKNKLTEKAIYHNEHKTKFSDQLQPPKENKRKNQKSPLPRNQRHKTMSNLVVQTPKYGDNVSDSTDESAKQQMLTKINNMKALQEYYDHIMRELSDQVPSQYARASKVNSRWERFLQRMAVPAPAKRDVYSRHMSLQQQAELEEYCHRLCQQRPPSLRHEIDAVATRLRHQRRENNKQQKIKTIKSHSLRPTFK